MNAQSPSIGRIVHYVDEHGRHNAAIITEVVSPEYVHLQSFDNKASGSWLHKNVLFDDTGIKSYSWHWPERG